MVGVNTLFETKPRIEVDKINHIIKVVGHYPDEVRCAKLTLLCEKYGATILRDGYAEIPYNQDFIKDLQYINQDSHFLAPIIIAAIIAAAVAAVGGAVGGIGMGVSSTNAKNRNTAMADSLREKYPWLTQGQIDALIAQYGDVSPTHLFDFATWGDQSDNAALERMMQDIDKAYAELGEMPDYLSMDQLKEIEEGAFNEIDAENRQLLDLYNNTLNRTTESLQEQLLENNAAFSDYRNQILTNDMMSQQAIAGATRFELDRQQRNAISRGASAAQRLVANINTQLGLQAQSAQQALNTSNALAQQLLAHRQAQAGIRSDYISALNQNDANRANVIRGNSERRLNYANNRLGYELDRNQYARDSWNERLSNYFRGNSLGEGIYRNRYGTGRNSSNNGL